MRKVCEIIIAVLAGTFTASGATIAAASPSWADVSNAVRSAASGDTVSVPAGTAAWTGTLVVTNAIAIVGAGIGETIIQETNSFSIALINWTTPTNSSCRLSGFTFQGLTNMNQGVDASIIFSGWSHSVVVSDNYFHALQTPFNLQFNGWVYGVVARCRFNLAGDGGGMQIRHDEYGGHSYGDGSWAAASTIGTISNLVVEDCWFANYDSPSAGAHGVADCYAGGRFVLRNNLFTNCVVGTHGTESSGRYRSVRHIEVYRNAFYWETNAYNPNPFIPTAVYIRGGTGVVWSNTVIGGIQYMVTLANYREFPSEFAPWGNISGSNNWDSNSATLSASGTINGTINNAYPVASVQDATASWTPNEFANFWVYNTNLALGFSIWSNTVDTLYFNEYSPYAGGDQLVKWTNGHAYRIRAVTAALDSVGRGVGDLITGASPTAAWPNQALEPVYVWGNSLTMQIPGNPNYAGAQAQHSIVRTNLDYYNDSIPSGYTALQYPHPMTTSQQSSRGIPLRGIRLHP